ncbi:hypothetical protein ACFSAG_07550 [Sphingorhabdus buctiana]|uniref:Uncharacterized protein n=1 Tax=Sphingorhabdus buctiana TaxID=1508805 RepID=A0ABW4MD19_9SPHN
MRRIKQRFERLAGYLPLPSCPRSIGCLLGNVLLHHGAMICHGLLSSVTAGTISIFIGDMIGSWVIIYGVKAGMDFYSRSLRS